MDMSTGKDQAVRSNAVEISSGVDADRLDPRPVSGTRKGRHATSPDERRSALLFAAEEAFIRKGFSATTMDEIAGAVGMSKKTVYKLFASKIDLFRAMIQSRTLTQREDLGPDSVGSAVDHLRFWLRQFGRIVFSQREIALQRFVIREAMVVPNLAEIFADVIIDPGPRGLIESVKGLNLRPALRSHSAREVADMFIGVVYGSTHFKLILSDAYVPDLATFEERIDLAVALFCGES